MKSSKHITGKKINLNLKDPGVKFSRLSPIITQCYLLGAISWLSWLFEHLRDGLEYNHNEMFLADLSETAK